MTRWGVIVVFGLGFTAAAARAGTMLSLDLEAQHAALAARPGLDAVGLLRATSDDGDSIVATGTLIGDRYVLTAAHAVDHAATLTFTTAGDTYRAAAWATHPAWTGDNFTAGVDLALLRLDRAAVGVAPLPLFRSPARPGSKRERRGVERDLPALLVGYGAGGTGARGSDGHSGTKRAGWNRIDGYFSTFGARPRSAPLFTTDFDATGGLPLEYQPAPGDSGGPALLGGKVAGVVSFLSAPDGTADATFGDRTHFVRVLHHDAFLATTLARLRSLTPTARWGTPGDPILPGGWDVGASPGLTASAGHAPTPAAVPEPAAAWALLLLVTSARHRRRRVSQPASSP